MDYCVNYSNVWGRGDVGGIAGTIGDGGYPWHSTNYGHIGYLWSSNNRSVGGIVGCMTGGKVYYCTNYGTIKYYNNSSSSRELAPSMGQIIGHKAGGSVSDNICSGSVDIGTLHTEKWASGFLNLGTSTHNRAQYAGNRAIGQGG
jgi:hypothetical protein